MLTLPSGRVLGYAEFGAPNGRPLLFFHGFPSSRLEARGLDLIARKRGIRVLALDRPGFGLSGPQPGRRIVDWPDDVRAFARHVHLDSFAVLGGSGGAPYALACAKVLPADVLQAVGLVSAAPPWEVGYGAMPYSARLTAIAAYYFPYGLSVFASGLVGVLGWVATTATATGYIDQWLASFDDLKRKKEAETKEESNSKAESTSKDEPSPANKPSSTEASKAQGVPAPPQNPPATDEASTPAERRDRFMRFLFEPFAQSSEGLVQEAQLLSSEDWGFRFEDVAYNKIMLWHGTKDANAPVQMIRDMAGRLPHAVLREFDENHFTMANHLEEILSDLIPEAGPEGS
jgi:pimeloyl-ACP methyl ester carboxylesterase